MSERIRAILEERRSNVGPVRGEIAAWQAVDGHLVDLARAVEHLRDHERTPPELRVSLQDFGVEVAREGVADAVRHLRALETRFARSTVNIGVSGQARVGKSTLLQSISGLSDEQIPTGAGLPVTAVRSRIFHQPHGGRAILHLHTFESFAAEVLGPHHHELGLPGIPPTAREFAAWPYPPPGDAERSSRDETLLDRLRDMQASLPTYEADLTGGEREVDLGELRQYVAYPTNDQLSGRRPVPRRYLAVRDLRVECPFPHARVERLGVVDLPGLGEIAVGAESHHVEGLQHEVDVVLMVKRAAGAKAFWDEADASSLVMLERASGFVPHRDFVFLVLNQGGINADMQETLRDDIRRRVNIGERDRFFQVLEADASDPAGVFDDVLEPVLTHLARRLPSMDAEVLAGTRSRTVSAADRVAQLSTDLGRVLTTVRSSTGSVAEDVDRRTRRLRQDLAAGLQELVARLRTHAREAAEDPDYLAAVDAAYSSTREWIVDGLGVGEQDWRDSALRHMRVAGFGGGYAGDEFNRVRVEISEKFAGIDLFFAEQLGALWSAVADVMSAHLGTLLDPPEKTEGVDRLRQLADLLTRAHPPCPRMSRAVAGLLDVRLDYRSQLHPRVRSELDGLALEVPDPETGRKRTQIVVETDETGAEELYRFVSRTAEQAAYLTKKALIREAVLPAQVLHAAAEQFEDTLIRSGDSELEFKRLADSYKNEIWPGVYQEMDAADARVTAVTSARDALAAGVSSLPGRIV